MNLHEYQGKKILEEHGVRIQEVVLDSVNQIDNLSKGLLIKLVQVGLLLKLKYMRVEEVKVAE